MVNTHGLQIRLPWWPPGRGLLLTLGGVLALGIAFLAIFTESVPFYYEDVPWISRSAGETYGRMLARFVNPMPAGGGPELFHRPAEELALKLLHDLAGFRPEPYRWLKNATLLGIVSALVIWLRKVSRNGLVAWLAGVWLVTACPIYQSTLWICDFEVVAHMPIVACVLLWHSHIKSREPTALPSIPRILLLNALAYAAMKTKGSAAVLPLAVLFSAALLGWRRLVAGVCVATPMLIVAVLPRILPSGGGGELAIRWANVTGFAHQLPLVIEPALLFACFASSLLVLVWPGLMRKFALAGDHETTEGIRSGLAICTGWMLSAIVVWPILPSPEARYLVGFLVPAITLMGLVTGLIVDGARQTRYAVPIRILVIILLMGVIGRNVMLDVHFRGFRGRQFIAIQRAIDYVEKSHSDAAIFYRYWRQMFYPAPPETSNRYVFLHKTPRQKNLYVEPHETEEWIRRDRGVYGSVIGLNLFYSPRDSACIARVSGVDSRCFDRLVSLLGLDIREIDATTMQTRQVSDPDYGSIYVYLFRGPHEDFNDTTLGGGNHPSGTWRG